ncbi:hypothetical protein BKA70DRAFT_1450718 [Coprinopsis sp. MPI-PUGE-AT-0042]|nr:hypothetical protein BKA70DRAFT_1450718 [Coprinopsis sp. MPI-PUGE-AT-0042]
MPTLYFPKVRDFKIFVTGFATFIVEYNCSVWKKEHGATTTTQKYTFHPNSKAENSIFDLGLFLVILAWWRDLLKEEFKNIFDLCSYARGELEFKEEVMDQLMFVEAFVGGHSFKKPSQGSLNSASASSLSHWICLEAAAAGLPRGGASCFRRGCAQVIATKVGVETARVALHHSGHGSTIYLHYINLLRNINLVELLLSEKEPDGTSTSENFLNPHEHLLMAMASVEAIIGSNLYTPVSSSDRRQQKASKQISSEVGTGCTAATAKETAKMKVIFEKFVECIDSPNIDKIIAGGPGNSTTHIKHIYQLAEVPSGYKNPVFRVQGFKAGMKAEAEKLMNTFISLAEAKANKNRATARIVRSHQAQAKIPDQPTTQTGTREEQSEALNQLCNLGSNYIASIVATTGVGPDATSSEDVDLEAHSFCRLKGACQKVCNKGADCDDVLAELEDQEEVAGAARFMLWLNRKLPV